MPPSSKRLAEEGAAIVSFKLVDGGEFQEDGISELLMAPATSGVPDCSGTRNLGEVMSDLKAQVAANHQGITLMKGLVEEYGLGTVQAYMHHIQVNAERAVRVWKCMCGVSRSYRLAVTRRRAGACLAGARHVEGVRSHAHDGGP